jgi:PAS domain S-box-containing protein
MEPSPAKSALRFSLTYGLVSVVCLLAANRLVALSTNDPQTLAWLQAGQDVVFILLSAGIFYWALKRRPYSRPMGQASPLEAAAPDSPAHLEYDMFQTLLDSSSDHIYFKDARSRFLKNNLAHARKFKLRSPEEMVGKADFDFFAEAHARAAFDDEQEIIRTGRPLLGKVEKESWKDGRADSWALTAKWPFRNHRGDIIGTIGISKDITDLKRTEEELLEKTAFLETLIDSVQVGVLVVDQQGRKILQNRLMCELWKVPRPLADNPDNREQLEFIVSRVKNSEAFLAKIKHLYAHPDEVSRDILDLVDGTVLDRNAAPVRDKSGRYYGRIWTFRDITREQNAENALRLSEAQLRTTFEGAAIGIALLDMDGRLIKCNPALAHLLGHSQAELCDRTFAQFTLPEDLAADAEAFRALLAGTHEHFELEKRLLHRDGQVKWVRMTISLVRQADQSSPLAIGMVEDITQRRSLEEQVRQSQKMEAIGLLASGVAHDFNNVLAIVQLQAGLLGLSDGLTAEQQAATQEITQAAERAANLTRQLLMFRRKQNMQPAQLDLNQVVSHMTKLLQRILGEDITLVANYAPQLPLINADAGMMEQILLNLAVNSRDAMPRGGQLAITTGTARLNPLHVGAGKGLAPGLYVRLTVTDTGTGIAPENLPHIFELFFTTKEVGKGTGLGLATVYGIVEQHRGSVNVTSEINQGATFNIYLPAADGEPAMAGGNPLPGKMPAGTETILVVEDASAVRTIVCQTLRRCGYNILQAESGREALAVWPQYKDQIDLLLTDIVMPNGLTGFELARRLLADKPDLKVIYTSGYSGNLEGNRSTFVEGLNFLQKPYSPQTLAATVRKNLDQK